QLDRELAAIATQGGDLDTAPDQALMAAGGEAVEEAGERLPIELGAPGGGDGLAEPLLPGPAEEPRGLVAPLDDAPRLVDADGGLRRDVGDVGIGREGRIRHRSRSDLEDPCVSGHPSDAMG